MSLLNQSRAAFLAAMVCIGVARAVPGAPAASPDGIAPGANRPEGGAAARKRSSHWSLQPLKSPRVPQVKNQGWVRTPVDSFIGARIEEAGLVPSPEADRATLIRRLSFDLLGLPPTPAEVEGFVGDPAPEAYEVLVDRLLASPHYGERWGRHWLDVARYTESDGFEYDKLRDNAWPYRDYVINSFNADKPYSQFIKEQIAGDALEPVTSEGIVATSLLVCGSWDEAGSAQANVTQRMITREEEMEDLISVVGQTFLGLTLNCARCHAHKFDPIPQEDYYRIKSVLEGVRHGERLLASPAESRAHEERLVRLRARLADAEKAEGSSTLRAERSVLARRKENGSTPLAGPTPLARWTFENGAQDSRGSLHGTLKGGATVTNGWLRLNGEGAFVQTSPLPKDVTEKTLEVWLKLPRLDQGGGGAISVESGDGVVFDSIVFAERQPRKWMAGSSGFERTRDLEASEEAAPAGELIHLAIVYRADNSLAVYRNGKLQAPPYTPGKGLQTYTAGNARVLFGLRHSPGASAKYLAADIDQASLYDRALAAAEVAASFAAAGRYLSSEELVAALTPEERRERERRLETVARARAELKAVSPLPVAYTGNRQQPGPTRHLKRGDVKSPAEVMTPGALSIIEQPNPDFGLAADSPEAERRVKLAEWIADPRNPLTARVMANRIWHWHFGMGIVPTANDLGASGTKPSHPELLDWLAAQFIGQGWSIKSLHRLIVCSATYRQSSGFNPRAAAVDADNQLLWRFTPRRLEAEALRDAFLAVSGQINLARGGPSFRPFEHVKFPTQAYVPVDRLEPDFNRRTVYRMNVNSGKDPMLDAFDCPDPATKTPRRGMTTTPLQALGLMNNSFVQRQASFLAERVLMESQGRIRPAIQLAYRYAFGRGASPAEIERGAAVAQETSLQNVCWALLNATEFLYLR